MSPYLDYLPASLQQDPLLARFLHVFERILSGLPGTELGEGKQADGTWVPPGIEQILDRIDRYFVAGPEVPEAERAPAEFLPWLAGWVAVSMREDWDESTRRQFVQKAPGLYRQRGTKACLEEMLKLFLLDHDHLVVDDSSATPHYFTVRFRLPSPDSGLVAKNARIARAIIDQEKPVHTYYGLIIETPSMQIVDHPTRPGQGIFVARNTLLGTQTVA